MQIKFNDYEETPVLVTMKNEKKFNQERRDPKRDKERKKDFSEQRKQKRGY